MIKIISPGKQIPTTTTCSNCGCVFSYEYEDTYLDYQLSGFTHAINCPCCGSKIPVYGNYSNPYYPQKIICDIEGEQNDGE